MRRRTAAVGTLFVIAATVPLAGPAHAQDLDCRDFRFQEEAQAVFDADPTDPHRLDEDQGPDDGIACEALPRRGGGVTSSTTRPTSSPTPTTVAPTRGARGGLGGASTSGPGGWDIAIGVAFLTGSALTAGYLVKRRRS
ncbi:excalibur calcium-binding protein [Streptomyces sp. ISL-22]|uniref:Excalibur calcium-binding protein n=1 Tax=Streptomyces curacoi TaxID=146536 RepID=A0A117NZ65_9ACTN|nr:MULTISPECIES: excalibur calcium-binding domain-containing protein [Streptomyces]KUM70093.1 excalibur calcium-binding protein [Streptomyces curacoi]MBT2418310.1 excalibur calcium-binding protein [Streptomyces sp. ISL-24]MBT2432006.1 excalibur calcium-binding protein [Streptomyces sp. ISL-22]